MNDYTISVGVPFSGCEECYCDKNIIATREDEAVAIAAGAWLAGKNPIVYMQNSGLGNCIDVITSLLIPYEIDIEIKIQNRDSPEHHAFMGKITKDLVRLLEYGMLRSC